MGSDSYQIIFTQIAIDHLRFWHKSGQKSIMRRIEQLLESISIDPASGIGKPEMLRHEMAGKFSRRINKENRIIYQLDGTTISILSLKGHY